jgi:hypothetical protein
MIKQIISYLEYEKDHPRERLFTREKDILDGSTWARDVLCNINPISVRNKF